MRFRSRVFPRLALLLGPMSVAGLSVPVHAQSGVSCTYGNIDHTSANVWQHQYCAPPTFLTAPLSFAAVGTYPQQFLGTLQGGQLNGTATVVATLVGAASGMTVTNVTLSNHAPPQAGTGATGLYLYGDVSIDAKAAANTVGLVMNVMQEGVTVLTAVDALHVVSGANAACQQEVTPQLQVTSTQAVPMFNTQLYTQVVTLKNIGGAPLKGPVLLGLKNLSANAQLFAGNGPLPCGAYAGVPYQFAANGLASGASARVVLTFTNSLVPQTAVAYTPVVLGSF